MGILFLIVLSIILEYFRVKGSWMSTLLPLPDDLELLIDSMYDDGYSAEYLVPDISRDDLAQSDLAFSWEKQEDKSPSKDQLLGIMDLDRDGARNQPWINFTKAVFVPNEIDYKIRAKHKFHPHSGRIGGSMQKQEEGYHGDEFVEVDRSHVNQQVTSLPRSIANYGTSESLDFLLPIPELGLTNKPLLQLNKKVLPLKAIEDKQAASKPIIKNYTVPNYSDISGFVDFRKRTEVATKRNTNTNGVGSYGLVNLFKNKIRPNNDKIVKIKNEINNEHQNSYTLDGLYEKLLRTRNEQDSKYPSRKSEEEKHFLQTAESGDYSHLKRLRAMRPLVTHTRCLHPGHRSSYIPHIESLSAKHNTHGGSYGQ